MTKDKSFLHFAPWQGAPIQIVHFYRSERGDAGFKDIPVLDEDVEAAAGEALLSRFKEPKRGFKAPLHADVTDEHGRVLLRLRIAGPDRVDRVADHEPQGPYRVSRVPQEPGDG